MGKKEQTRPELSESQLIDFLYIDKSRVDSLISQIRSGTLRSVTKTIGTSEGSSVSVNGGVPAVVSGLFSWGQFVPGEPVTDCYQLTTICRQLKA